MTRSWPTCLLGVPLLILAPASGCKTRLTNHSSAKHHLQYLDGAAISSSRVPLLSGQGLRQFIREIKAKDGMDVLKGFQALEKSEGFKLGTILLSHSDGLKTTTFQYPRVILFHPKMDAVIGFNVNPKDGSCNDFEILELAPRVRLDRVRFVGDGNIAQPAITSCAACHGLSKEEAKPLFDSYAAWPNSYLAKGLNVSRLVEKKNLQPLDFLEVAELNRFLQRRPGCYAYLDLEMYTRELSTILEKRERPEVKDAQDHRANSHNANFHLDSLLGNANFERIARQLQILDPALDTVATLRCVLDVNANYKKEAFIFRSGIEELMPKTHLTQYGRTFAETFWETEETAFSAHKANRARSLENGSGVNGPLRDGDLTTFNNRPIGEFENYPDFTVFESNIWDAAAVRFVFEPLGHHIDNWSMRPGSPTGSDGNGGLVDLLTFFSSAATASCVEPGKHVERLAGWPLPQPVEGKAKRRRPSAFGEIPVIFRCARCHGKYPLEETRDPEAGLPPLQIPFEDAGAMRELLKTNPKLRESVGIRIRSTDLNLRMPPEPWAPLDEDEIVALEAYLNEVGTF